MPSVLAEVVDLEVVEEDFQPAEAEGSHLEVTEGHQEVHLREVVGLALEGKIIEVRQEEEVALISGLFSAG